MQFQTLIFFTGLCLLALPTPAADLYRWVDSRGQTQLSDKVPPEYQGIAEKMNSRRFELTPAQKAEAQARATRERDRAARAASEAAAIEQSRIQPGKEADETASSNAAAASKSSAADCAARWKAYNDSETCFAPFKTVYGGVKPEAFQHCVPVVMPTSDCPIRGAP